MNLHACLAKKAHALLLLTAFILLCGKQAHAQIQPDQVGFPPDSNRIWLLGVDTVSSNLTYGKGRWYALDSLIISGHNSDCTIEIAMQVIVEQHDIAVLDGLIAHVNVPASFDGWTITEAYAYHTTAGTSGETEIIVENETQTATITTIHVSSGNTEDSETGLDHILTAGDLISLEVAENTTTPAEGLRVVFTIQGALDACGCCEGIDTIIQMDSMLCVVSNMDTLCVVIDFAAVGDDWGNDIVEHDVSLDGSGTSEDPLSVVFPVDTVVLKYIIEAWDIDVLTDLEFRTSIPEKYDLYEIIRVDAWHIEEGAVGGSTDIEVRNLTQTEAITTGLSITQGSLSDSVTGLTAELETGDQIQILVVDECNTPGQGLEIDIYLVKQ